MPFFPMSSTSNTIMDARNEQKKKPKRISQRFDILEQPNLFTTHASNMGIPLARYRVTHGNSGKFLCHICLVVKLHSLWIYGELEPIAVRSRPHLHQFYCKKKISRRSPTIKQRPFSSQDHAHGRTKEIIPNDNDKERPKDKNRRC